MRTRSFLSGIAATAVTASVLALTGPAAFAAPADADDTNTDAAPGATADLVGVGSDTTQGVVKALATGYNATSAAASSKIVSWAATAGGAATGTITLPDASSITRPGNSGAGKTLLYGGTGNAGNTNIDFARSSSANSTAENAAGLQAFPFAVDTLIMVKSGQVASHAPASLSVQQVLDIYTGKVTNWNQIGGTSGTIKPLIPNSGSGTRSFFVAQLTAANGGVAPTFASSVTSVQEHDPAPVQGDADAIAPFSLAKKTVNAPTAVTTEPGFSADRAVYNVVRGSDVANPAILAAFGPTGYFCSPAGKSIIEAQGFRQLYPATKGGACGQPTQNPTTNLITADVTTTTKVTVSSASASSARITAAVTGSTAPNGTVSFYEGSTLLASGVPLVSGQAVRVQPAAPGAHTYRAVFTPAANTPFTASEGTGTGTVAKATSSISAKFPKKVKAGKKVKGLITVTLAGATAKASGPVTVTLGKKTVGKGTLSNGVLKVTLKKLKLGKNKLTITWAGDANATGSTAKATVKVVKVAKKK
jgi:ABC-type phosphate transport system substrate-binding protein